MFNGTSFIAMRSIASKLVPSDELGKFFEFFVVQFFKEVCVLSGKINSLFGVCEALMPLVYGPMYSIVYKETMEVMPGAFFLLGGILTAPAVGIFG